MTDFQFESIETCIVTWKTVVQQNDNYHLLIGGAFFMQMFKLAPGAISLLRSFEDDETAAKDIPDAVYSSPGFIMHAKKVTLLVEKALIMMLRNKHDDLANEMQALGGKHLVYGVKPFHYALIEAALLRTLESALQDRWTPALQKDWAAVFKFLANAMRLGSEKKLEITKMLRAEDEKDQYATIRLRRINSSTKTSLLSLQRSPTPSPRPSIRKLISLQRSPTLSPRPQKNESFDLHRSPVVSPSMKSSIISPLRRSPIASPRESRPSQDLRVQPSPPTRAASSRPSRRDRRVTQKLRPSQYRAVSWTEAQYSGTDICPQRPLRSSDAPRPPRRSSDPIPSMVEVSPSGTISTLGSLEATSHHAKRIPKLHPIYRDD